MSVSHSRKDITMTSLRDVTIPSFTLFRPPYRELCPCGPDTIVELADVDVWKGAALVWHLSGRSDWQDEFASLRQKAPGLPLLVLLPPADEIGGVVDVLPRIRVLYPRLILPHGIVDSAFRLRQVLSLPPQSLGVLTAEYLVRRGLLRGRNAVREFQRTVELAPEIRSIGALSRRMYTSRRTLGRHFAASGMPVPSHCLQFARLLHVAVTLQTGEDAVFRVAARFGYTDGFTLSNQMKRLTGHRPSEVRGLLGWEWIVESWLKREGAGQDSGSA
jgi:AraC-like DNA-binding protein